MGERTTPPALAGDQAYREVRRRTRRGLLTGGLAAALGFCGWNRLRNAEPEGGLPWPLRRALELNERLALAYFREGRLAPTFPPERVGRLRVNGEVGLNMSLDRSRWRLRVENPVPSRAAFDLTLDDVKALPRVEMITEFKCVEGWSVVVRWAGARLADFMARYRLGTRSGQVPDPNGNRPDLVEYVSLETPDRGYYVGLDMPSALHPQTLLCYEMNGGPLGRAHGAPLRLVTAVKYGYKSLKQIGTIRFLDRRPPDFWAERGYDWYAGH